MDYYLNQICKGQNLNIEKGFRKLGDIKRKIIEAKQRDYMERKDMPGSTPPESKWNTCL